MKKYLVVFIVSVIVLASTMTYLQVGAQNTDKEIKSRIGSIYVRIPIGSLTHRKTAQGDDITLDGFGRHLLPGTPNLPSQIFSIAIPPGTAFVSLQYTLDEENVLPGSYEIAAVPVPQVNGQGYDKSQMQENQRYLENYAATYSAGVVYPESVVEFERIAGFRQYNLVDIRVNPVQYTASSGTLTYYPEITVEITYKYQGEEHPSEIISDTNPFFETQAQRIVLNYQEAAAWYQRRASGIDHYPFVILTLDSLTSCVDDLVAWEQTKGKNTQIVTISWIDAQYTGYDLAEKIRNFLREKYRVEEWGIEDLLIVGHRDDIPMRETWQDAGGGHPETDFYYAELSLPDNESWDADGDHQYAENSDPIDFYAEITVGRIPWSDPETVEHIIQKSVSYEQCTDPSFKNNILLLGGFIDETTDGATFMEYMANTTHHPWMAYWMKTRLYEWKSQYPKDYLLTHANVVDVWSQGKYAFVSWHAHGSPQGTSFININDCQYLNDDYPAIISAASCSNSDTAFLNIGQAMMRQGAVGFLGANKIAYYCPGWNDPSDGSDQSMKYFFKSAVTSENYTQGQAHQYALSEMYRNGLWNSLKYETFVHGSLWGNPDLGMKSYFTNTGPAQPATPEGPARGKIHVTYTYSSSTTDVDNDNVYYFFSWGDGFDSGWIGPYSSGEPVEASHSWTQQHSYEIAVIAQDSNGTKSAWSDPFPITMPCSYTPSLLRLLTALLERFPHTFPILRLLMGY